MRLRGLNVSSQAVPAGSARRRQDALLQRAPVSVFWIATYPAAETLTEGLGATILHWRRCSA